MKPEETQLEAIARIMGKEPSIPDYRFTFGRYKGYLLEDVARANPGYLEWLKANMDKMPKALSKYLKEEAL